MASPSHSPTPPPGPPASSLALPSPPPDPMPPTPDRPDPDPSEQALEDPYEVPLPPPSTKAATVAKFRANPAVRFAKRLAHNAVNKVEDVGVGVLGATTALAEAGEGVGRTAVSGVGAVGSVVEGGVAGALALPKKESVLVAREVDTVTDVDISGTVLKDLNRAIEVQKMKGTSNAESPLNTPWILLIFPILPIAFMYTKTALAIALPPTLSAVYFVWTFFGWRFWFCLVLLILSAIIIFWNTVKAIDALKPITMQVDVAAIKLKRKVRVQTTRQMPKIYKALDTILPPFTASLSSLDLFLKPKLGFSPLLAVNAKLNGWIFDPNITDVLVDDEHDSANLDSNPILRDRGTAVVVSEDGVTHQSDHLEFDPKRADVSATPPRLGAGEMFEQYFSIELCLTQLAELHRSYTSIWLEWMYRDMVVDRSVIRDISTSDDWKGYGASFDRNTLTGEVRLPLRAATTTVDSKFFDIPIRLVLKGRDGLPIYSNDGARRYMRDSPPICVIGEIELSAMRIGAGADREGVVRSELRIPLHALGVSQYRAAVLRASARITPIDNSSYSYRQMLSPLPNGEWTVKVNVFELRNLKGVDNTGSSDPFVSATAMGIVKKTDKQRQTLSCMVNQLLFFSKLCTGLEFENEKIKIEVMDWNRVGAATKIGVYTLDAKRVLELPGRELYRKWFALQDPDKSKRPAGFIKMSVTVVPPGGTAPHHADNEDSEEFSNAKLLKNSVLKTPKMSYQSWAVHVTVGWADMLPRMASAKYRDAIRGYVTFDYSGFEESRSNTFITHSKDVVDHNIGTACRVLPQRRIIWNEEYVLPLTIINGRVAQEGITLKLFHKIMPRLQSPMRTDQPIGTVNVSFEELFNNMTTAVIRGDPADGEREGDRIREVALMKPRYYNFYGRSDGPADPYDKGYGFRGRVLVGVAAKPGSLATPFLRPCPPPPRPKLDFYKMTFCVLRATELPLADGWSVYVECRIGLYQFGHTIPKAIAQNSCAEWDENCAVSIPNMQFPEDVEQIPDFFVTLWGRKPSTVEELEEKMAAEAEGLGARRSTDERYNDETKDPHQVGSSGAASSRGGGPDPMVDNRSVNDGQWQPKAFLRLPAKRLICGQQDPQWMFMDYPGNNVLNSTDNVVPGSILMSASLCKFDPTVQEVSTEEGPSAPQLSMKEDRPLPSIAVPETIRSDDVEDEIRPLESNENVMTVSNGPSRVTAEPSGEVYPGNRSNTFSVPLGEERTYTLRALIMKGRDLPAADESGLSDPFVTVSMGDQRRKGQSLCRQTITPLWEELLEVPDIRIRDGERKPNVNVLIYDYDGEGMQMDYLGRCIIPAEELDTAEPSIEFSDWYPVFSVNPGLQVGEILADFQLIPTEVARVNPMRPLPPADKSDATLRISLVGLRDLRFLQYAAGDMFVECSVSGVSVQNVQSKAGTILQQRSYEANCNILDVLMLQVQVPGDMRLAPALNIFAYAKYHHSSAIDLVATACIPLDRWLNEHDRKLITGEALVDDSYGMDSVVPKRLLDCDRGYRFRKDARRHATEHVGVHSLPLHEIKALERGEKKNQAVHQENSEVRRVGFLKDKKGKEKVEGVVDKDAPGLGSKISAALAPIRAMKYQIADSLADLMPDVAMALGIEVDEEVSLSALRGDDDEKIDYDGTLLYKRERGFCPVELEVDFSEPAYGEFSLFRGDNRSLGNTNGRIEDTIVSGGVNTSGKPSLPPILPMNESVSSGTLVKREKRRAVLEGARPSVGKVKARLDLVEMDGSEEDDLRRLRMTSLRSFGRVFVPSEVVVRVYVLRALNLQQVGSQCNPYLTARFYGGFPDYITQKHNPVMDDDNPNFFQTFESRVKMPGGCVRIEVKDRILPEVTVPLSYPMYISADGQRRLGMKHQDIPVNVGKFGLGWSETIGETVVDLDARWYNPSWKALAKTPVERRPLYSTEGVNLKGQLEMFVDIFDANDVDARPKMFKQVPIQAPQQEQYEIRVVVYKVAECLLPYRLAENDAKLAAFYVMARLGNRPEDMKKTEKCKWVPDGVAEFNWRMKWSMMLPSMEVKPRLKLQVYDDTSSGLGDDQLCATVDIKLRSLFDEIMVTKKPIIKKRQWVLMQHPNHPDVEARIEVSMELTTAELAQKKKCFAGREGYKATQHEDYVLPLPFQPKAFSIYNPVPYVDYMIRNSIRNLEWTLATVLLIFPFMPMFVQFVFMVTPWQWYASGGVFGLAILIRLSLVSAARTARQQAELQASLEDEEDDE